MLEPRPARLLNAEPHHQRDPPVARVFGGARQQRFLIGETAHLDHLARGGRVPGAASWGARWLGLHPLFEFREGRVRPLRPARGRDGACQRMVALWAAGVERERGRGARLHVAALHAQDPAVAEELLGEVSSRVEPASSFVGSFTPVMVAHTGPSLAGLAWWWEAPAPRDQGRPTATSWSRRT